MKIINLLKLSNEDMHKQVYLFPAYLLHYRWHEIVKMNKFALWVQLITTLVILSAFFGALYIVLYIFIGDPKTSIKYNGTYGLSAGIIYLLLAFKVLQGTTKLIHYLFNGKVR